MIMRLVYSIILMVTVFVSASAQQRLASPQLTIKEPTFVRMSDAKVSWAPVEGADSYSVRLDGETIEKLFINDEVKADETPSQDNSNE